MKSLKENLSVILLSLFEIVVGILLLISPVGFTTGIIMTAGVVLIMIGVITLIQYFRTKAAEAAVGKLMFKSLVCLALGAFFTFGSKWIIAAFPLMTIFYGAVIMLTGISKVQNTFDMIRSKRKRWWMPAIGALISIVCAVVIFANPFSTTAVLWMFTGISLIVEAVTDIALMITASVLNKGDNA